MLYHGERLFELFRRITWMSVGIHITLFLFLLINIFFKKKYKKNHALIPLITLCLRTASHHSYGDESFTRPNSSHPSSSSRGLLISYTTESHHLPPLLPPKSANPFSCKQIDRSPRIINPWIFANLWIFLMYVIVLPFHVWFFPHLWMIYCEKFGFVIKNCWNFKNYGCQFELLLASN